MTPKWCYERVALLEPNSPKKNGNGLWWLGATKGDRGGQSRFAQSA